MSTSVRGGDSYQGNDLSLSQLLTAAKRKLQHSTLDGRCVLFGNHDCRSSISDANKPCRVPADINLLEVTRQNRQSVGVTPTYRSSMPCHYRLTASSGTRLKCFAYFGPSRILLHLSIGFHKNYSPSFRVIGKKVAQTKTCSP